MFIASTDFDKEHFTQMLSKSMTTTLDGGVNSCRGLQASNVVGLLLSFERNEQDFKEDLTSGKVKANKNSHLRFNSFEFYIVDHPSVKLVVIKRIAVAGNDLCFVDLHSEFKKGMKEYEVVAWRKLGFKSLKEYKIGMQKSITKMIVEFNLKSCEFNGSENDCDLSFFKL